IDSIFVVDRTPGSPTLGKPHRVGNTFRDDFCALRSTPTPPYLSNVAFPGADILAVLNTNYAPPQPPASPTDAYKLFLLGGKTELQWGRQVQPTFVTVWLGNNGRRSHDHRVLGHARDFRCRDTQHARHRGAVQRDNRPSRRGPAMGVCRPESAAKGARRGGCYSAIPGVPARPQLGGRPV